MLRRVNKIKNKQFGWSKKMKHKSFKKFNEDHEEMTIWTEDAEILNRNKQSKVIFGNFYELENETI